MQIYQDQVHITLIFNHVFRLYHKIFLYSVKSKSLLCVHKKKILSI